MRLSSDHGEDHLETLVSVQRMGVIGRHDNHLARFNGMCHAVDSHFGLTVDHLYGGIERGGMLARP